MSVGLHVKCPLFLSDFNEICIFSTFSKNSKISNFIKIRPVRAEFFHSDGRTEKTKLIVAFHSFAKAPKNSQILNDWIWISVLDECKAVGPAKALMQLISPALSPNVYRTRHGADHSPPYRAEVKNAWSNITIPTCPRGVHLLLQMNFFLFAWWRYSYVNRSAYTYER